MPEPIIVAGAGPAGMATALALRVAGHDVHIYERAATARQQGGGLNLWAPAVKALRDMGVDTDNLGTPCPATFRNAKDHIRADVQFDPEQVGEYGGYIFALPRPELYARMRKALPDDMLTTELGIHSFVDHGGSVSVTLTDGTTRETPFLVGADGIHSKVRRQLFGETQIREHNLHVLMGFTHDVPEGLDTHQFVVRHSRTVQGSWAGFRSEDGRPGIGWFIVEAWDPTAPVPSEAELMARCAVLAEEFPAEFRHIVATSEPQILRWPIRDLGEPPQHWSVGRAVILGDAAHATSPYAAYGAGMSVVDGYFLGQVLAPVDLADTDAVRAALQKFEKHRVEHTSFQVKLAHTMGQAFHHAPPVVRQLRDFVLDHTPVLQKQMGEKSPGQISDQIKEMGAGILQPA